MPKLSAKQAPPYRAQKPAIAPVLRYSQQLRVRGLQMAAVSLMTLSLMNSLFLRSVHWLVNFALAGCSVGLLWLSFRLWHHYRRRLSERLSLLSGNHAIRECPPFSSR